MNIQISPTTFNALIPLKMARGPVLKLTENDKKLIRDLQDRITEYELKLITLEKIYNDKCITATQKHNYYSQQDVINCHIDNLLSQIREIKVKRITEQRRIYKY